MNQKIVRAAFGILTLIVTVSCTTAPPRQNSIAGSGAVEDVAPTEKRIRIYGKYDRAIPEIIHDLKQCAPLRKPSEGEAFQSAQWVIDYGIDLESSGSVDAEEATVRNEMYWKAIVALSANDITALLTRLLLLMREGELRRAKIVFLFCAYDQNQSWDRDSRVLQEVAEDAYQIEAESNRCVEEGIRKWDQGQRSQALELYNAALDVFPKNPWALWELALDHLTYDFDPEELTDGRFDARYRLIRRLDPHYELAYYQGQNTPEKRTAASALTEKVLPGFAELFKGENVLVNMRSLADGYFEMREYEFAIYAYKYILFRTYDDGFDQAIVGRISTCLERLGMERVVPFLDQFLSEVERMITSERKRLQAAREQVAQIQAEGHSRISSSTLWKPLTRV
jgi:tetratricopeptide (TPR) repeat protein